MRNSLRSRLGLTILIVTFVQFPFTAAGEVQVKGSAKWGVGGCVVPQQFNLVTVELQNDSAEPWRGAISLTPVRGLQRVDVPVLLPEVFIPPLDSVPVQFVLYLEQPLEAILEWGQMGGAKMLVEGSSRLNQPFECSNHNVVELSRKGTPLTQVTAPKFESSLFPENPIVLEALAGIVLSHVPDWEAAQTQAFRDWLFAGGTLYLTSSRNGEILQFPASLSELNNSTSKFRVGAGKVVRLARGESVPAATATTPEWQNEPDGVNTNLRILTSLTALTAPIFQWSLMNYMALAYLLILFPGCWFLSRRRGDYRLTYGTILATVGLFSFGFYSIGKRGYGEEAAINSVVLAQASEPGRWIVKQWTNVFVTDGTKLTLQHPHANVAYSTGQSIDHVAGLSVNTPQGMLVAEIPSFSDRTVFDAGLALTPGLPIDIEELRFEKDDLAELRIRLVSDQPLPEPLTAYAVFGETFERLDVQGDLLVLPSTRRRQSLKTVLHDHFTQFYGLIGMSEESRHSATALFERTQWAMIANDLGLHSPNDLEEGNRISKDTIHLFLNAPLTSDFFAKTDENFTSHQNGIVIYSHQIPVHSLDQ